MERRALRNEGHQIVVRLHIERLCSRRPDGPGSHIPEIDELAARVARRVAPAPGDRAAPARARPASGVGYDGDVVAVGQKRGRSEERRVGQEWRSRWDWSSELCSSDLESRRLRVTERPRHELAPPPELVTTVT